MLIILALVLPVAYRLSCKAEGGSRPVGLLKLSYFLGLLRARAEYTDALYVRVKVLFFTVFQMKIPDKEADEGEEYDLSELDEALEALDDEEEEAFSEPATELAETQDDGIAEEPAQEDSPDTAESPDDTESTQDSGETDESGEPEETVETGESAESDESEESGDSLFDKIRSKIDEICDKIKKVRSEIRYYRNLYNSNEAKNAIFVIKKRLKRIFKKVLPRKAHADLTFGFDSPDLTGKVYGVYTMIAGRFDRTSSVRPDFERKIFEGDIFCKGHFNLWCFLWNGLLIILNRNVLKIYRSFKHHNKKKEKEEAVTDKAA
ncbi:MAG: hypothetical protein J6X94_14340 [Lachnospiraceae bacterium]|nr:hypothetical protein [Lachnospiraceae bacterium]